MGTTPADSQTAPQPTYPVLGVPTVALKVSLGLAALAVIVAVLAPLLILLLPFRRTRIKLTNHAGTLIGRSILWLAGCPLQVTGREHARPERPAIYVGNHTSILDAFTSVWLAPTGTVGIAKREIIYYPFFGQAWLLSGHLLLDRRNRAGSVGALGKLAAYVRRHGLGVLLWPEGTRAADGRLGAFKKGFAHLALQTGLPVVPMVTSGAHGAWEKGSMRFRQVPITIRFLPAIDTSAWARETLDEHIAAVRQAFIEALPADQRPHVAAPAA